MYICWWCVRGDESIVQFVLEIELWYTIKNVMWLYNYLFQLYHSIRNVFSTLKILLCSSNMLDWQSMMASSNGNIFLVSGPLVSGEFPAQRTVTQSFDVFFDLCLNKCLSKQSRGWWFETLASPLWRHCNALWDPAPSSMCAPLLGPRRLQPVLISFDVKKKGLKPNILSSPTHWA